MPRRSLLGPSEGAIQDNVLPKYALVSAAKFVPQLRVIAYDCGEAVTPGEVIARLLDCNVTSPDCANAAAK